MIVEPGHAILTVLGAPNRDPAMFENPHTLKLGRPVSPLIRRFDEIELAGEPHWRDRITIRGVDRLALVVS